MKRSSLIRRLSTLGVTAVLMLGPASAAEVHVMISAGFYRVYSELGPAFERASGHHLVTTRGPSMGDSPEAIPTRLARGETADVVILDGGAADELGKRGMVRADSKVELARSLVWWCAWGPQSRILAVLMQSGERCLQQIPSHIRIAEVVPIYRRHFSPSSA